jgi:GNAT superfamily N-acetyltransferase
LTRSAQSPRSGPPFPYRRERLASYHAVETFDCGDAAIDKFLHDDALAEQQAGLSSVTVALDTADGTVVGYYTLSPVSIRLDEGVLRTLGLAAATYPMAGGYLFGRLGVTKSYAGQGIGSALVAIALDDAADATQHTGGVFLAVDPKDDGLVQWYEKLGFARLDPKRRRAVRRLEIP